MRLLSACVVAIAVLVGAAAAQVLQRGFTLADDIPECTFLAGPISPSAVPQQAMVDEISPVEFSVPLLNVDNGEIDVAVPGGFHRYSSVYHQSTAGHSRSVLTFRSPFTPFAKGPVTLALTFTSAGLIMSQCRISKAFTIIDNPKAYISLAAPRVFFHSSAPTTTAIIRLSGAALKPFRAADSIGIRFGADQTRVACLKQTFTSATEASCELPLSEIPPGPAVVEFSAGEGTATIATFPITVLPEPRAEVVSPGSVKAYKPTTVTFKIADRPMVNYASMELALFESNNSVLPYKAQWKDDNTPFFDAAEFTVDGTVGYAAFILYQSDAVRVAGSRVQVSKGTKPVPSVDFVLPDSVHVSPAAAGPGKTVTSEFRLRVTGYNQISSQIATIKIGTVKATRLSVHGRALLVRAALPAVAGALNAVLLDKAGKVLAQLNSAVTIEVSNNAGAEIAKPVNTVAFVTADKPISVKIAVSNAPAGTVTVKTNAGAVASVREEKVGRMTVLTVTLNKKCGDCIGTVGRYVVNYAVSGRSQPIVLTAAFEYVVAHTVTSVWPMHFDFHTADVACIPYVVTLDTVPSDVPLSLTLAGAEGISNGNPNVDFAKNAITGCLTCTDCKGGKAFRAAIASPRAVSAAETLDISVSVLSTDGSQGDDDGGNGLKPGYIALIVILVVVVIAVAAGRAVCVYRREKARQAREEAPEPANHSYGTV